MSDMVENCSSGPIEWDGVHRGECGARDNLVVCKQGGTGTGQGIGEFSDVDAEFAFWGSVGW